MRQDVVIEKNAPSLLEEKKLIWEIYRRIHVEQ